MANQQLKTIPKRKAEKPSVFYDYSWILSKNRLFNWVMGIRGGGKTYGGTKMAVDNWLKRGEKTVWVRRYAVEMDGQFFATFFSDMEEVFPDCEFCVKQIGNGNAKGFIRKKDPLHEKNSNPWEQFVYFMALSIALKHKSTNFSDYTMIFCDEWAIDPSASNLNYINGWQEPFIFYEFVESVVRLRDNVKIIFASNALSSVNPYFSDWGIKVNSDDEWYLTDSVCVHNYTNETYKRKKAGTKWGRFLEGTKYGRYNMENEFYGDLSDFIVPDAVRGGFVANMSLYGQIVGVWTCEKGILWIGDSEPSAKLTVAFNASDMRSGMIQDGSLEGNNLGDVLVAKWKFGLLRFRDIEIQTKVLELIGLIRHTSAG